jgi:hypothetical protein
MQMLSKKRALDKIYKRRDRYEIPDWQRGKVWDLGKKQELIDSILRGWKLPKFYFVKTSDDPEEFEVVDGQQRLSAIFEFFDNALPLSAKSAKQFNGRYYKELQSATSDEFDDFEIEYDELTDATEQELKDFFQRLQQGLPLTSSEKLNAVHSNLRNFCRDLAKHNFFQQSVSFSDKRYAYFDVAAKASAIEIEGLEAGLRFDDLKAIFEHQVTFSAQSAVAKRLRSTFDYLRRSFPNKTSDLRNRSVVQSIITLASRIVATERGAGQEAAFRKFIERFISELTKQVELGLNATDPDYVAFQRSVNANVREGAKTRHEILLRKMFRANPKLASIFDPSMVAEAGVTGEIHRIGDSIDGLIEKLNVQYSAKHGNDLFKPTTKTIASQKKLRKPASSYADYKALMENLYFLFWEGTGSRLDGAEPQSFKDINELRTDLQHDVDHGKKGKVAAKRKKMSAAFAKYGTVSTPQTMAPEQFVIFQLNLLSAIENDLQSLQQKL